jgi:hypothetical protein
MAAFPSPGSVLQGTSLTAFPAVVAYDLGIPEACPDPAWASDLVHATACGTCWGPMGAEGRRQSWRSHHECVHGYRAQNQREQTSLVSARLFEAA